MLQLVFILIILEQKISNYMNIKTNVLTLQLLSNEYIERDFLAFKITRLEALI